ncbi:hypothetical protein VTO73DRAFT_5162 [Trametes versicolor]
MNDSDWDSYQEQRFARPHTRYTDGTSSSDNETPSRSERTGHEGGEAWQRHTHREHMQSTGPASNALVPRYHHHPQVLLQAPAAQQPVNMTVIVNVLDKEGAKQVLNSLPDLVKSQSSANNGQRLLAASPHVVMTPPYPGGRSAWRAPPPPPWMHQGKRGYDYDYDYQGAYADSKRRRAEVVEVTDEDEEPAAGAPVHGEDVKDVAPPHAPNSMIPPEEADEWLPSASVKRQTSVKRSGSETARRQEQEAEMYNRRVHSEPEDDRMMPPPTPTHAPPSRKVTPALVQDRGVSYAPQDATESRPYPEPMPSPRFVHYTYPPPAPERQRRAGRPRKAPQGRQRSRPVTRSMHLGPPMQRQPEEAPLSGPAPAVDGLNDAQQAHFGSFYPPRYAAPSTPGAVRASPSSFPSAGPSRAGHRNNQVLNREPVKEYRCDANGSTSGNSYSLGPVGDWRGAGA